MNEELIRKIQDTFPKECNFCEQIVYFLRILNLESVEVRFILKQEIEDFRWFLNNKSSILMTNFFTKDQTLFIEDLVYKTSEKHIEDNTDIDGYILINNKGEVTYSYKYVEFELSNNDEPEILDSWIDEFGGSFSAAVLPLEVLKEFCFELN